MARILVVEDNPDNMKLFRTLLVMKGHQVTGLFSGDGLLETMSQAQPELVLMDIQLPGRDGFALLKELRASPWAGVSVVALTAHAMSGDQEKARAAGFDDYITKPIDIATFGDQVARTLRQRRPPTETRERG
jgi:CheY-like chemotaxis protein